MTSQEETADFETRVDALWKVRHMKGRPPQCWLAKLHRLDMSGVEISELRPCSARMMAGIPDPLTETLLNDPNVQVAYRAWLEDVHWGNMQRTDKRAGQKESADRRKNPSRDIVHAYKTAHGWDEKFKHFKENQAAEIPEPSAMQIANWWIAQGKCGKSNKPNLLKRLRRLEKIK